MRTALRNVAGAAGVLLGLLVLGVAAAPAAERPRDRSGLYRIEVWSGPSRAVRYAYGRDADVSPGDLASLRNLEAAENEAAYAGDLQALKRQYVRNERLEEAHRHVMQQRLYATSVAYASYGGFGYPGYAFNLYTTPFAGVYPFAAGYPYAVGYGYPYSYGPVGDTSALAFNLGFGVGDEGPIKTAMAPTLARQATPEYAAAAARDYDRALARAYESPRVRTAAGLPERGKVSPAAGEEGGPITLTLEDGTRLSGTKLTEGKDWYVLETKSGATVRVRASKVVRVDAAKGAVKPAGGD
jgi:hypothetical protein